MERGLSVVIPAFNEEGAIGPVVDRLVEKLESMGLDWEVVVVDDGSTDGTGAILRGRRGVTVIRHPRNRGYGAALKTGIGKTSRDRVLFYDADGQFRPQDIPALWEAAEGADMATGKRGSGSDAPLLRRPGKKILGWTADYLVKQRIPDLNCGFRIVRRELLLRFLHLLPSGFSASTTLTLLLLKEGYEVRFVPVTIERRIGTSTVNIVSDGFETLMLIVRLVTLLDPLRVYLTVSGILFLLGLVWGGFYFAMGRGVTQTTLLLLITGALTFLIGLVADQVAALRREYHR